MPNNRSREVPLTPENTKTNGDRRRRTKKLPVENGATKPSNGKVPNKASQGQSHPERWWVTRQEMSLPITPDNLGDLIYCWNKWKQAGHRLYFRGESDCLDEERKDELGNPLPPLPYPLQPALVRKTICKKLRKVWNSENESLCALERRIFDRFKRHSAHLIEADAAFAGRSMKQLEMLCLSQHFGLPTRLLDWTLNPFVALYFALVGEGNFNPGTPCRLWVMVLKPEAERDLRTIHLENQVDFKSHKSIIDLDILEAGSSKRDREDFVRGPYIVVPLVFTRRIAAQSGRFVYCPHLKDSDDRLDKCISRQSAIPKDTSGNAPLPDEAFRLPDKSDSNPAPTEYTEKVNEVKNPVETPWQHLLCYPIDHIGDDPRRRLKEELLHSLEFQGYHSGQLFPDLSGWAKYLRQGFK